MNNWKKTISSMYEGDTLNLPKGDFTDFRNKYKIHQRKQSTKKRNTRTFCILVGSAAILIISLIITSPKNNINQRRHLTPSLNLAQAKISLPSPAIQLHQLKQNKAQTKQSVPQIEVKQSAHPTDFSCNSSSQHSDKTLVASDTSLYTERELIEIFTDEVVPESRKLQIDLLFNNNITTSESGNIKPQHGANTSEEITSPQKVIEYPTIRIGARILFWKQNRWSLCTGIVYSLMQSSTFINEQLYSNHVSHYIGIPLQISYLIYDGTNSELYTNAGGLAQYCIGSNLRGISNNTRGTNFVISSQIGVGYSHRLGESIAIYIEPSAELILGELPQIYESKGRFSLNLEIGCRFLL